ncbi:hypothetical protein ADUPG1_012897, partial [Aduncisulcus paluster]
QSRMKMLFEKQSHMKEEAKKTEEKQLRSREYIRKRREEQRKVVVSKLREKMDLAEHQRLKIEKEREDQRLIKIQEMKIAEEKRLLKLKRLDEEEERHAIAVKEKWEEEEQDLIAKRRQEEEERLIESEKAAYLEELRQKKVERVRKRDMAQRIEKRRRLQDRMKRVAEFEHERRSSWQHKRNEARKMEKQKLDLQRKLDIALHSSSNKLATSGNILSSPEQSPVQYKTPQSRLSLSQQSSDSLVRVSSALSSVVAAVSALPQDVLEFLPPGSSILSLMKGDMSVLPSRTHSALDGSHRVSGNQSVQPRNTHSRIIPAGSQSAPFPGHRIHGTRPKRKGKKGSYSSRIRPKTSLGPLESPYSSSVRPPKPSAFDLSSPATPSLHAKPSITGTSGKNIPDPRELEDDDDELYHRLGAQEKDELDKILRRKGYKDD